MTIETIEQPKVEIVWTALDDQKTEEEKIVKEIQVALQCDKEYAKELYLISGENILYYIG